MFLTASHATVILALFALFSWSGPAQANADICRNAAIYASRATGVPASVLDAISITETGRTKNGKTEPWPWTVNVEGAGRWFETHKEALQFALNAHARGSTSFDVGCFQLNFKWHGKSFRSIEHMFDPKANALYAAKFLSELYAEKGNWIDAAGAYHSRTPKYADKYRARFARIWGNGTKYADTDSAPVQLAILDAETDDTPRVNTFPLLLRSGPSTSLARGSLFPADVNNGRSVLISGME